MRDARLFWISGTGLCEDPSYTAHVAALKMRGRSTPTVFDLDWRPVFWDDVSLARERYAECLGYATVAIGNREECEIAVGETEPRRAAAALLERGVELAIVKQGSAGVLAKTADEEVVIPAMATTVMNGAGAGDAFGGSVVHGLLEGFDVNTLVERCNAAGAIVASRLECSTAMPTEEEILRVLQAGTTDVLGEWVARR